jgi:hypothetical protein
MVPSSVLLLFLAGWYVLVIYLLSVAWRLRFSESIELVSIPPHIDPAHRRSASRFYSAIFLVLGLSWALMLPAAFISAALAGLLFTVGISAAIVGYIRGRSRCRVGAP